MNKIISFLIMSSLLFISNSDNLFAKTKSAPKKKISTYTISKKIPSKAQPTTTKKSSNCDPNYSGCVPIASDVDCTPGKGDGPAYVRGPIRVIGVDIYGLDRDKDGLACE